MDFKLQKAFKVIKICIYPSLIILRLTLNILLFECDLGYNFIIN